MPELFNIIQLALDKRQDILNIPADPTWTEIGNCSATGAPAGTYLYSMAATVTFADTNDSIKLRFSLDGGSTWDEFLRESKDTSDAVPMFYAFPKITSGNLSLITQASKTSGGAQLDVNFSDVWIQRLN